MNHFNEALTALQLQYQLTLQTAEAEVQSLKNTVLSLTNTIAERYQYPPVKARHS